MQITEDKINKIQIKKSEGSHREFWKWPVFINYIKPLNVLPC